jgi:uncharacterized protein (DUF58 family)
MRPPLLQSLWQRYRDLVYLGTSPVVEPLLDAATLDELQQRAQSSPRPLRAPQKVSSHMLIGEHLSRFRGRGFEFEENRSYQTGDEPRLINWRLYARTGDLYTKVFNEERRPEVYLVADLRAGMRFGTRKQLKAALVAKIIASTAFQAQRQALAVGGIIIDETINWFSPTTANATSLDFLHTLALPCPPLAFDSPQPDLNTVFSTLLDRIPQGSYILCASDFSDLDPNSSASLLHQLNQHNDVEALMIRDPSEASIEAHGTLLLDDPDSDAPIRIDTGNPELHTLFEQAASKRQSQIADIFRMAGIPLTYCNTGDEIEDCLDRLHGRQ